MLQMTCPHCSEPLALADDRLGRPVRCPHCGRGFRAPFHDGEPATGARPGGSAADALAVAAAVVAVAGCLMTAAALLVRLADGTLPVSLGVLRASVLIPMAVIGVSWFVARKARSPYAVLVSRVAAYLWILGLLVLLLRLM